MAFSRKQNSQALPDGAPRWIKGMATEGEVCNYLLPDGTVRRTSQGALLPFVGRFCMAGRRTRVWLYYCVDAEGGWVLRKQCQYPFLATAGYAFSYDASPVLYADDVPLTEQVRFVDMRGMLVMRAQSGELEVEHIYYPAVQSVGLVEHIIVRNLSASATIRVRLSLPIADVVDAHAAGCPVVSGASLADALGRMLTDLDEQDTRTVAPDEEGHFYVVYWSKPRHEDLMVDCRLEYKKRRELVAECFADTLCLHTPLPILNRAFAHALTLGCEHIADTPLGSMFYVDGAEVRDTCRVAPLLALSGIHRAVDALQNMLLSVQEHLNLYGTVPMAFDSVGQAAGQGDKLTYALSCALYGLLSGSAACGRQFAVVEPIVEEVRSQLADSLYTPRRTADFGQQCVCYALFTYASQLAAALDKRVKAHLWQQTAADMRAAINATYGGNVMGFDTYRAGGRKLCAAVYAPLLAGIDDLAQGTAQALVSAHLYDSKVRLRSVAKSRHSYDADVAQAACALLRAGYAELGTVMLAQYAQHVLLSDGGPYPLRQAGGKADPASALVFCQSLLLGLVGITKADADNLEFCLHLPKSWRRFDCCGLHVGGNVLNLRWQDSHLVVSDIFGNVLYDDLALSGQHIIVALPRMA